MKLRYILPIIFSFLLGISFLVPGIGDGVVVLIWPVTIPLTHLSFVLGGPRDIGIIGLIAGLCQFYLIGLIIDLVADWLRRQPTEFDSDAKIFKEKHRRNKRNADR